MKKQVVAFLVILVVFSYGCAAPEIAMEKITEPVVEDVSEVDEESVPESQPIEQIVEEKQQAPTMPSATATQSPPAPTLINGKTLQERLTEAYDRLHTRGSGQHIRDSFPDIELVYTDDAVGMPFPKEIIPFRYYYSREANITFNICAVELTVFICKGKLDNLIRKEDMDSGQCEMTPIYGDPRI